MSLWSIQVDAGAVDVLKLQAVMEGNDISEGEMGESAALIDCQIVVCVCACVRCNPAWGACLN